MATLLLCCAAPLQSWDTQSRFGVRTSGREPSKSGIVGMLCAALGRPRDEPIADLTALTMGVRVDREGSILRDFHTAGKGGYLRAGGAIEQTNLITSTRYYLADAAFLVGLEGGKRLLQELHAALLDPHWMLCLGRKACPPSLPVYLSNGLSDEELLVALKNYPWLGKLFWQYENLDRVRIVVDDDKGPQVLRDHPLSFEKGKRDFAPRRIRTYFIDKPPFQGEAQSISQRKEES